MMEDVFGSVFVTFVLLMLGILGALLGGFYLHILWDIGRASWGWV
jgi:hypothetical protein